MGSENKNNLPIWLSSIAIFISIITLCGVFVCKDIVIVNESIMLIFVGVIATFIVVSNYAQVKSIEDKFEKSIDKISEIDKISDKVIEIKEIVYKDIANSIIINSYDNEKNISKDFAFECVLHAISLLLKNNIEYTLDCNIGTELINRFGKEQKISQKDKTYILEVISKTKIKTEGIDELKKYISNLQTKINN